MASPPPAIFMLTQLEGINGLKCNFNHEWSILPFPFSVIFDQFDILNFFLNHFPSGK